MSDADLPYDGTEGYSGTETSEARARHEAVEGVASVRQRFVLISAAQAGVRGVTVAELRDSRLHHGRVSGTLSVLHKVGRLQRLHETRNRCKVYVLPEFVEGRQTEPFGRRPSRATQDVHNAAARVDAFLSGIKGPFSDDMLFDVQRDLNIEDLWTLVRYAQGERNG